MRRTSYSEKKLINCVKSLESIQFKTFRPLPLLGKSISTIIVVIIVINIVNLLALFQSLRDNHCTADRWIACELSFVLQDEGNFGFFPASVNMPPQQTPPPPADGNRDSCARSRQPRHVRVRAYSQKNVTTRFGGGAGGPGRRCKSVRRTHAAL